MKTKKDELIESTILGNVTNTVELLKDLKKLTVEDVVVLYAYAEAIVETVREPLVILDENLRIKTANKAFFDTFQVNKTDTYNKLIFDLGNKQWNIPALKKLFKEILPKNTFFNDFEVTHDFKSIGKRIMILNARRIVLEGHKTELILLAIEDITQKKTLEDKLRESEQHYRWIVEQVQEHVLYSMDVDGAITGWNDAAEEITGYKKAEVLGKYHGLIYTPKDQKQNIPRKEMDIAANSGSAVNERWHMRKDKTLFWGSGTVSSIRDDAGDLIGYSKVMRDATPRIELDRRKDEFLSIASHELKTPITSIKAYAQVLTKRISNNDDKKTRYFINKIDYQTKKLVSLINDLLDISKIVAGKLVLNQKKFDLDTLIKNTVADFQLLKDTHKIKMIGVTNKIILGDEDRIAQVLINLLTNAIKYSPQTKEIIVTSKQNRRNVTVSIQDFGKGISKNKQKIIFEKYFQVNEKGDEGKKGFGLGLYIASQIIKRQKGKVWVESTKGNGATFYFTLPTQNNPKA